MAVGSYGYRSLTEYNTAISSKWMIPDSKQVSYKIQGLSKFVAVIDDCAYVPRTFYTPAWYPKTVYNPHGGRKRYVGFNRLWYAGHVRWFSDPGCSWQAQVPNNDTAYGNGYSDASRNTWKIFDERE
jgi:hypothetical protein